MRRLINSKRKMHSWNQKSRMFKSSKLPSKSSKRNAQKWSTSWKSPPGITKHWWSTILSEQKLTNKKIFEKSLKKVKKPWLTAIKNDFFFSCQLRYIFLDLVFDKKSITDNGQPWQPPDRWWKFSCKLKWAERTERTMNKSILILWSFYFTYFIRVNISKCLCKN